VPVDGKRQRLARTKANPLHAKPITAVDWKDSPYPPRRLRKLRRLPSPAVLLRTFISDRGKIRARRVTGLTPQQQRQVAVAIRNAREMALLPYPHPGRG
jgi:small subunit ribosomal protein S18